MKQSDALQHADNAGRGNLTGLNLLLRALIKGDVPIVAQAFTSIDVVSVFKRNGVDKTAELDAALAAGGQHNAVFPLTLSEFRKTAAMKDVLADTAATGVLGVGDAAGSVLLGLTTHGGTLNTADDTASYVFALPADYVAGEDVTVTLRGKVSAARFVSASVDLNAKVIADGVLGADICTTAAQVVNTAYADKAFTVAGATLTPGAQIQLDVHGISNDTGGSTDGATSISKVSVTVPIAG